MTVEKHSFKDAVLDKDKFSITWELVPGRGSNEVDQQNVIKLAQQASLDPRINAITLTDNPSGKPAIHPFGLAEEVKNLGVETLIHFTCKDKNRNDIESELYALDRAGLPNLLVMTGDYTTEGYNGRPKPVFDLDSVQTIKFIEDMNNGLEVKAHKKTKTFPKTDFFEGAVVSPFKALESEVMTQYYKMHQKVDVGAKYIITQVGWDARKFDELRKYVDKYELNTPLIGNIYVLSMPVARMMNKSIIPGAVVTDKLLSDLDAEKKEFDNNKERQLLRSAKLFAVLKGLKYDGVTIAGHGLKYEEIKFILDKGEELYSNWQELVKEFDYPEDNGFYYFEKDEATGLNTTTPVDRKNTGSKSNSLFYWSFGLVHKFALSEGAPLYPMIKFFAKGIDKSVLNKPFTYFEYYTKTITNECRFCGDCVMHELAFQCPMSQCAKHQRNGACGGGKDGWCEVYPGEKRCIYVNMYEKYKHSGKEYSMKNRYAPPADWSLYKTSSWLNFFNERDYNYRDKE
ncbi:methylenetetrahydrofolate reductase [Alkalibaculum sp. M08DMB]|uniref:Methylenetetrahydrofolate reductase n=1 Tax=Alkalibaculum sporogenes TaxID=2655001 RepID=A0A6A7K540_9FIRM|nr:methylenetetrahydrofolate reductase C-terminal domain-containing protein [Alkalibaculum sporogenes]MPW24495.1 methylenetetrahydrofolate reductase [Alkalibaculum sporogenes]